MVFNEVGMGIGGPYPLMSLFILSLRAFYHKKGRKMSYRKDQKRKSLNSYCKFELNNYFYIHAKM